MCGIAGFLDPRGLDRDGDGILARMRDAVWHRGPDDCGAWTDPAAGIALGHRRLSVLDLTPCGHQPMVSADGRWVIIFNGEIYNFATLRRGLEGAGERFRGHSDTEVILAGITRWGLAPTIARMAGMFAIALWDRQERVLHLIRDRLGEKPLYYGWQSGVFLFGSELKALRQHPACGSTVDADALGSYLRHGYVPGARAIYQGLHKLLPGCRAEVRGDGTVQVEPYWTLSGAVEAGQRDPLTGSDDELASAFEEALAAVVREQVVADVPVGAFLSGGIDSSTVVALMRQVGDAQVRTFSIGFHEPAYNEADHASRVARHLGTAHTELYVTAAEARDVIPDLPCIYDEPFADSSQIPTTLVARLARQHVTVALSGDGGDELLGGYTRYFQGVELWHRLGRVPPLVRDAVAAGIGAMSPRGWDRVFRALGPIVPARARVVQGGDRVHKLAAVLRGRSLAAVYERLVSFWDVDEGGLLRGAGTGAVAHAGMVPPPGLGGVEQMMYWDARTYLPDDIMVKVDRAAMSVSLETRAPFLDHRLIEFAWRLPSSFRVRDGVGKWGMRRVLSRHVPNALVDRPKQGFGVPIDTWLRGPLRAWATDLLSESRLGREGYLEVGPIQRRLQEHLSGERNWQYHLWIILMFEAWVEANRAGTPELVVASGGAE